MHCACGQQNPRGAKRCPRCGRLLLWGVPLARLAGDVAVAAGLLLVLGAVFLLDRGHPAASPQPVATVDAEASTASTGASESPDSSATPVRQLALAVTPPRYDDVGKLLETLGSGYRYTEIPMSDLLLPERLHDYDVLFLTCDEVPRRWWPRRRMMGRARGSLDGFSVRANIATRLKESLREFVARGGTLYASDWQLELVAVAFPEFIDEKSLGCGAPQTVEAEVVDPGLRAVLGPTIDLAFDKSAWIPAAFNTAKVNVYLRGSYQTVMLDQASGPLLVQFPFGEGNVIFTSFHNEEQNSATEQKLLRYLVFTTVTAGTESQIKRTMLRGGFSPAQRNLLSASEADRSVTRTYDCPGKRQLQFVLGFERRGAVLRLSVERPRGRKLERSGDCTFTIDVDDAEAGPWRYTVTPVKVPYENFPFTLTIGEKAE